MTQTLDRDQVIADQFRVVEFVRRTDVAEIYEVRDTEDGQTCTLEWHANPEALDPAKWRAFEDQARDAGKLLLPLTSHGYLFEVLSLSDDGDPGAAPEAPRRAVRAWPWEAGRTGRVAILWTPGSGLVGHLNADGRWSGKRPPSPAAAAGEGWRRVRRR